MLTTLVVAMVVVLLAAAATIDISDWYAIRHQAQISADAAALAAANCLAHPNMGTIKCSSPADTVDATKAAEQDAGNELSGSSRISGRPTYSYTAEHGTVTEVKVTARPPGAGFLSGLEPAISVTATASILMPANAPASGYAVLTAGRPSAAGHGPE